MDSIVIEDPAEIVMARESANEKMRAYLIALVQRRAGELQAGQVNKDVVTRLIRLSMSQALEFDIPAVILNVGGLLIGTVETTSQAVVHALAQLLERPETLQDAQQAARSDDPTAVDGYVFEALRFHPIAPYIFRQCNGSARLARSSDHETEISAGTIVLAFIHSAMFDETAFEAPDQFDPSRPPGNSMHFGVGLHECLGRPIARVLIPELARQCLRRHELKAEGPIDFAGKPFPENYWLNWAVS